MKDYKQQYEDLLEINKRLQDALSYSKYDVETYIDDLTEALDDLKTLAKKYDDLSAYILDNS